MRGAIFERINAGESAYVGLGTGLKVHKVTDQRRGHVLLTACGLPTGAADSLWHQFRTDHPSFCANCRRELERPSVVAASVPAAGPRCRFGRPHVWGLCYPWSVLADQLGLEVPAFVCSECERVDLRPASLEEAATIAN